MIAYLKVGLETPQKTKAKRKNVCKPSFQVYIGMDPEKYKNKVEMKERKKTTLLQYNGGEEGQEDYPTPVASGV